jgi:heme exporter protein B
MSGYASDVVALARKDLRLELRSRETLPAMVLFVVSMLVVFHFALPSDASDDAAYGVLWVALVFTALLGLTRSWVPERTAGALDGLVLAPSDRSAIWLGKTIAAFAFLLVADAVALPVFSLLFAPVGVEAVGGVLLASAGICAVGALASAMATAARGREILLPLILLPLSIPLIVGGVGAGVSEEPARYLAFLGLYDAVFALLSWAAFEYVVTE